ncbi:MAG: HNH endonuclease signature motif containing protein [Cyanobacteria bacterium J06627_15]
MNPYYTTVSDRANHRCEYCQAPELGFNFPFEVDHNIPISQQGPDDASNLALSCRSCNLRKGSRTEIVKEPGEKIRFYNPRKDVWADHFVPNVDSGQIAGITPIGKVTVDQFEINSPIQVTARQLWMQLGLFP